MILGRMLELIVYYLVEISYLVGISYRMTPVQMRELFVLIVQDISLSVIALYIVNRIQKFLFTISFSSPLFLLLEIYLWVTGFGTWSKQKQVA